MFKKLLLASALLTSATSALAGNPLTDTSTFPIAVWWQSPATTGHTPSGNEASTAAAAHINIFLGLNAPGSFGTDTGGDRAALAAAGVYYFDGISTPSGENASASSVASMKAAAVAAGSTSYLIGYNGGDEPQCGSNVSGIPAAVSAIKGFDGTGREVAWNFADWPAAYFTTQNCITNEYTPALQSLDFGSFDVYPPTNPWRNATVGWVGASDYNTVGQDSMWYQAVNTTAMLHYATAGEPVWAFVETGGDFSFATQNNTFTGGTTNASANLTDASGRFTAAWVGMTVAGTNIQSSTTISSITNATTAVMSKTATGTGSVTVTVTGGSGGTDCVYANNICVINGNQRYATAAQIFAEAWMGIIAGATGIEWFCHDTLSTSFCLGDSSASSHGSVAALANITYVNSTILTYAQHLRVGTTVGMCSMETITYSTQVSAKTSSCSNGSLALSTGTSTVPALGLLKHYGSDDYLFVQTSRRGASGAAITMTMTGFGSRTWHTVFDSNSQYDAAHDTTGASGTLSSGAFTQTIGANSDHYQVLIYKIDAASGGGGGGSCCHGLRVRLENACMKLIKLGRLVCKLT